MGVEKLEKLAEELEQLSVNLSRLMWTQYTVGYDFGIDDGYKKINDFIEIGIRKPPLLVSVVVHMMKYFTKISLIIQLKKNLKRYKNMGN